ncbi:MAG: gliding motility-associated C-terminal domain-containing protein [Bacteroidia bacterium]
MKKLFTLLVFVLLAGYSWSQTGPCIGSSTLTLSPPPDPGTGCYFPGTTVTVCVTINDYAQSGVDWLCGVVPILGPGWDSTTLAPVSPSTSCDGQGYWAWYPTATSTNSGITFGPGFFYDTPAGATSGMLDSIPGNNFGDNCQTYAWVFCFQVSVSLTASAGASGGIGVNAYGDDIAGSWGSPGCVDPPITTSYCIANCTVTVPTLLSTDVQCYGDSTGTAVVTPLGGYPPYNYSWSTGATTQSISGLTGGVYSVIVTDSSGCAKTVYVQIQSPPQITFNALVTGIGCGGSTTGSIFTNIGGGTPPYTYLWNTGATTDSLTGLTIGNYTITITDSLGCFNTNSFSIVNVPPLSIVSTSSTDATCGGSNGSAAITVNGTPPYTYVWTPPVSSTNSATGLASGTYVVQVMDSNGCQVSNTFVINSIATFTSATSADSANCAGTGGSATVNITGASGPFIYQWSPSGGTDSTAVNLNSGTYTVIVTDANSCSQTISVVVPQMISTVSVSTQVIQSACSAASTATIYATGSNGTGTYTYLWSTGASTDSISGLAFGTYTVTATDGNQCSATANAVITPYVPVSFTSTSSPSCPNSNTGSATVITTTGGTPPYTYLWSDGSTSSSISGIASGTYTVTVTDASSCTSSGTLTVSTNPSVALTAGSDTTICSGQSATITALASGGTPNFSYSWSNSVTSSQQQVTPASTTTYTVTVTDGAGCQTTSSVTVNVNSYPATVPTQTFTICSGASVSLTAPPGSTYSWSPTDDLSNSTVSNPVASPGSSTLYIVSVSNGNCSSSDTVDITVLPTPDAIISVDSSGGNAINFINQTTGAQTYLWVFGDGATASTQDASHEYASGGIYQGYMIAYNANGCSDTATFRIETNSSLAVYNVFTPNGDSHNDIWKFDIHGVSNVNAEVYNRWGEKIFEWNHSGGGLDGEVDVWDGTAENGKAAPDGTYFYIVTGQSVNKDYNLNGTVTLINDKK